MSVMIRKMTDEEFEKFYRWSIDDHAKGLMEEYQMSREKAIKETKEEFAQMLPDGLHTDQNYLMVIEETVHKEIVGFVWTLHEITEGKKQSYLCDFVVFEPMRRKGFATAALTLLEKAAAEAGCQESVLFVADRNYAASALYEKTGYQFLRQLDNGKYMLKQL